MDDGVYALNLQVLTELWRRSHHRTPTLEEITQKFQESTVFSKLDTRDGYWSVVLREESSYLPPFSPFGRLRFLLVFL